MEIRERAQIEEQYKWDLTCMFSDDDAFVAALEDAQSFPARIEAHRQTACASAKGLLDFLNDNDTISIALIKLGNYAQRRHDEDTRVAKYQDWSSRFMSLAVQISQASSWFTPELLSVDPAIIDSWFDQEPELIPFRRYIDGILRMRPHTLPAEQEALLAAAGELAAQPENIYSMFNNADLTFPDALDSEGTAHPVTHGSYIPLVMSPDRTLRQNAFDSLYGTYEHYKNTSASVLGAQVKSLKLFADARGYASNLEASLFPTEVPVEVYENLIASVHANLDKLHDYVTLRRELLGVDELHYWDLYTPMVADVDMEFTYEQACEIICEALAPLGEDYVAIVKEGLSQRWIDVYENPGKRSGAYSAGGYGIHPVILLNFQGKLDDVFTLIHEMGHSVHTYLSCKNQPPCYSDYEMFVAEVASTTNECLLLHWFLAHETDPRRRAYLLNHYLEQFRATLYRQTMFAEFEREVNQMAQDGAGITADALCEKYAQLNADYFGDGIVADAGIAHEWARIPHFFYDFYVYVYATSFSAAVALSQRILEEGSPAVADYLGFLSSGSSKPPIELLRDAGVDMSTSAPIDSALAVFGELLAQMRELMEQIG